MNQDTNAFNLSRFLSSIFIKRDQKLLCDSFYTLNIECLFLLMKCKRCQVKGCHHHGSTEHWHGS